MTHSLGSDVCPLDGGARHPRNSRHFTRFSHHFNRIDPDTLQRQERQIVQSQLDLQDFLP